MARQRFVDSLLHRLDKPIPFEITAKGLLKLDDLARICATCGAVGFKTGFRYGEDYFCDEHEPEGFRQDFREQQRLWDEEQEWPQFDCYWTKWETADEY